MVTEREAWLMLAAWAVGGLVEAYARGFFAAWRADRRRRGR